MQPVATHRCSTDAEVPFLAWELYVVLFAKSVLGLD